MDETNSDDHQRPTTTNSTARRRTAYACDSCRTRKTRCNGQNPCSTCAALAVDCVYGLEAASTKGKSDLILNAILRVERSISQLDDKISSLPQEFAPLTGLAAGAAPVVVGSPNTVASSSHSGPHSYPSGGLPGRPTYSSPRTTTANDGVDNAIISQSHNSTTESVLQWSTFDSFPALRTEGAGGTMSIFQLENTRPAVPSRPLVHPYASESDIDNLMLAFQKSLNFSYPTISFTSLSKLKSKLVAGDLDDSSTTCLALLVMALGCATRVVGTMMFSDEENDVRVTSHFASLGHVYFDAAIKKIHHAYAAVTTESAQCLLLAALYYAYLQRPLQAWSLLSSTAIKCRVMLSYGSVGSDDMESIRRIFWSCFILESDYLAELSALPHMGVAEMESTVPLPGRFHTHEDHAEDDLSSLYFLACISMRRLLNRVHHLLFDTETGVNLDDNRFPGMVAELDQQLEKWRELLPPAFQFTVDTQPVKSQHGAFLRQRYLTCKALIHRPYLMRALANDANGIQLTHTIIEPCTIWLHACMLHILNLRGFAQTVLVDTWICALSMSGTMMMLLAAYQVPALKENLGDEVLYLGSHLRNLLARWIHAPGQATSPSIGRALHWITTVDDIFRQNRYSGREVDLRNG